jgi:hypothetical protein
MKWLLLLALVSACKVAPRDDTCKLAERVAHNLEKCRHADKASVADLLQVSLHASGTPGQQQFACAKRLEEVHGAAFEAGCMHQLTRLEMGELDDVLKAGPNGSAAAAGVPK